MIVTAAPGYSFINDDGNVEALLAAYNLFDRVLTEGIAEVEGQDVYFSDVCYKPAEAGQ